MICNSILDNLSNLSVRLQEIESESANTEQLGLGSARFSLVNALEGFRSSRFRLGQRLSAYKAYFKANQGWMTAAKSIASAIGCEERTIRRTIDDFERVSNVPDVVIKALQQAGFDPAARKNAGVISKILRMPNKAAEMNPEAAVLSAIQATKATRMAIAHQAPEKRMRLAVRKKIRTALTSVPVEQELAELVAAIEEEMYTEWGQMKPTIITFTPHAPESADLRNEPLRAAA